MESAAGAGHVGVVTEYHHPAVRRQADIGEQETDPVSPVAQADALQADGPVRTVPDLDPVGIFTVLVRHGGIVGGHDLADHQAVIHTLRFIFAVSHQAGLCGAGIGCPALRLLGRHQNEQHHQRDETGHDDKVHPGLSAAQFRGAGSRTASLHIRVFFHTLPLLPKTHKS